MEAGGCIPLIALGSHQAAPSSILGIPKNFYLDVAKIYCLNCLEHWTEA